ncbi:hypothetical protein EVAR_21998_1 [Eumeta japonica]|uniref:Uncharacterized protein n=1 Tax=Eumeta variegata TaxID=151549 RepID=A0A4C1Z0F4_EUMVA|nr:hypothetical protein EVAR_21998_1 [Eumeta japonica]
MMSWTTQRGTAPRQMDPPAGKSGGPPSLKRRVTPDLVLDLDSDPGCVSLVFRTVRSWRNKRAAYVPCVSP